VCSSDLLVAVIRQAYQEGGKVVIPAFAVERTQELLYTLAAASRAGELPTDMPVFLDSPLAIAATEIFRAHPEYYDDDAKEILANGDTPLDFPNLRFTPSTAESQAINERPGPAVIIAGNGMGSAGRIKHHLKHNVWRPECHVVIVGFQAQGTTGRLLVDGATKVKIFREDVAVRAKIHTIGGFSAHADQAELLSWLEGLAHPGLRVNLVHAEEATALDFQALAAKRFPQMAFYVPRWNEVLPLSPQPVEVPLAEQPLAARAARLAELSRRASARLRALARRLDQGPAAPAGPAVDEKCLDDWEQALAALEALPEPARKG
jgi:metallo-beta-lactamase family protein